MARTARAALVAVLALAVPAATARHQLSVAEQHAVTRKHFRLAAARRRLDVADGDLAWREAPGAWHQQLARIVDHRFTTFDELYTFATDAKKAGVSALMLVQIQKTEACPGPWYNGLQLCDHINGSYPVASGSLAQWKHMLAEIAPMRLMWWNNPVRPSR